MREEKKTVWVRWTIEYPIEALGEYAEKDHIEFHRNEGTFCNDTVLDELQAWLDAERERQGYWDDGVSFIGPCLCELEPLTEVVRISDD